MYSTAQVSYGPYFDKTGGSPLVEMVLGMRPKSDSGLVTRLFGSQPFARICAISYTGFPTLARQQAKTCKQFDLLRVVLLV